MDSVCELVMTDPSHYEVSYVINPWMQPQRWSMTRDSLRRESILRWKQLYNQLIKIGARVHLLDGVKDLPDLVFPANAAIVLDRKALLARFAHPQRQREEKVFQMYFTQLGEQGVVSQVEQLPAGMFQEGAGDCLWDSQRQLFWSGYGQRSLREASGKIADFFHCEVQPLELVDPRFYHLDVALAVLEGGEVLYYPNAFSRQSQDIIRHLVKPEWRIEVGKSEAIHFNVNVISALGVIFMTRASSLLRGQLTERGYGVRELNLSPFLLAGGAAACLTLRLDHRSGAGVHFKRGYHDNVA